MNVNQAIKYLEELRNHPSLTVNHRKKLRKIANLFKRLPRTLDGYYVLPDDELESEASVLFEFMPYVAFKAYYITTDGQHIADEIGRYNFKKKEMK